MKIFNSEERKEREAEHRAMNFQREQGSKLDANQEMVDIQQQEARTDLLKWQQDLTDEAINMIHRLRREVEVDGVWVPMKQLVGYDEKGKQVYAQLPPYMNEMGIQMVVDQCGPLLSRNIINSNFSEERILKMLEETCNAIADNLADAYDVYAAEFINFDVILRLVKNTIVAAPFRALHGWNKKLDSTVVRRVEAHHEGLQNEPKKKLLGLF